MSSLLFSSQSEKGISSQSTAPDFRGGEWDWRAARTSAHSGGTTWAGNRPATGACSLSIRLGPVGHRAQVDAQNRAARDIITVPPPGADENLARRPQQFKEGSRWGWQTLAQ